MPDLDLPQGEPMSPASSGNSGDDEDGGEGEGEGTDGEGHERLSHQSAGQTGKR